PGIVTKERVLPDFFGDLLPDRKTVVAFGHFENKALGLAAGVADFLRDIGRCLLVHVRYHHPRAFAGIAVRDRAPDAGAGTGDDRDMILEKGHGAFPLLLVWAEDSKRAHRHKAGSVAAAML